MSCMPLSVSTRPNVINHVRRVVIQQVDLDTCLTALLLGVERGDHVVVVRERAEERDLADLGTYCIEAGGSGRVAEANFDHHDPVGPTEPACRQALAARPVVDPVVLVLVDYVAHRDVGALRQLGQARVFNLTALFSGMRLVVEDPVSQLWAGLGILQAVIADRLDPAGPMPDRPEWRAYASSKRALWRALETVTDRVKVFATVGGVRAGFVGTDVVGAIGQLHAMGCEVAIVYSQRFRTAPGQIGIPKYSIGGRDGLRVDGLLPTIAARETGWGGPAHGTIISSPRTGSRLEPLEVTEIVRRGL